MALRMVLSSRICFWSMRPAIKAVTHRRLIWRVRPRVYSKMRLMASSLKGEPVMYRRCAGGAGCTRKCVPQAYNCCLICTTCRRRRSSLSNRSATFLQAYMTVVWSRPPRPARSEAGKHSSRASSTWRSDAAGPRHANDRGRAAVRPKG